MKTNVLLFTAPYQSVNIKLQKYRDEGKALTLAWCLKSPITPQSVAGIDQVQVIGFLLVWFAVKRH